MGFSRKKDDAKNCNDLCALRESNTKKSLKIGSPYGLKIKNSKDCI